MLLIVANIGTAVALFPVLKRQHEGLALGFVTARVMESVFIAVGILSVLTIVTMRQDFAGAAGADAAALSTVGHALVTLQEWTFMLGPGFVVGVGQRPDPRLPDVPVRPGSARHGRAGPRRRLR